MGAGSFQILRGWQMMRAGISVGTNRGCPNLGLTIGISQSSILAPDSNKAKSATALVFALLDRKSKVVLEDPVENIRTKLVRQATAKANDLAGDGTTTFVVLAQGNKSRRRYTAKDVQKHLYLALSSDESELCAPAVSLDHTLMIPLYLLTESRVRDFEFTGKK